MERYLSFLQRLWHRASASGRLPVAVLVLLLCLSLLRGLQGLNLSDDGFVLSAYIAIFSSPGSVAYSFLYYWLVNVGGLWNWAFGDFGIYGFRVLECVFLALNSLLVYSLAMTAEIKRIYAAVALVFVFSMLYWIEVFEYNTFSAFAALLMSLFMLKALVRKRFIWMFVAGVVYGFGIFVRLPNAALCALILVLIPFCLYEKDLQLTFKMLGFAVAGTATGVALTFAYMYAMGHLPYFTEAFETISFLVNDAGNSHSTGSMLYSLLANYARVAMCFVAFSFCPVLYVLLCRQKWSGKIFLFLTVLLLAVHVFSVFLCLRNAGFIMNAMAIASCVYAVYVCRSSSSVVYLACLALGMALFLPLGSDNGIATFGVHNLWLALLFVPLSAALWLRRHSGRHLIVHLLFVVITSGLVLARNAYGTFLPAYYEGGTRADDVCLVDSSAGNVLTDAKTSSDVRGILTAMDRTTAEGDTVLTVGDIPLLHYLTRTVPYLRNTWPWIFGEGYCRRQLGSVRSAGGALPVVVFARKDMMPGDGRYQLFREFLKDNGYSAEYSNDAFVLFVPPSCAD